MKYTPIFQQILQQRMLMPLMSGSPLPLPVSPLTLENAFEQSEDCIDSQFGKACLAAAYLYLDHWDVAHRIAQNIPTSEGSYWHAIIHRREPDYWNSKYWFRQVDDHPVFHQLASEVPSSLLATLPDKMRQELISNKKWDPFVFVDVCEQAAHEGKSLQKVCEQIQTIEFNLLFDYCFQRAVGKQKG